MPAAWHDFNVEQVERSTVELIRADVGTRIDAAQAKYDVVVGEANERQAVRDVELGKNRRKVAGIFSAFAIGAGATIGAILTRGNGPLAGAGLGVFLGGTAAAIGTAIIFDRENAGTFYPMKTDVDRDIRKRLDAAHGELARSTGRDSTPPWLFQQDATKGWKVGESGNAGLEHSVRDFVEANAAAFDHDGNGFVDLSSDSGELVRDKNGGPVTSATRAIRSLPSFLVAADANHDQRLSPEEAVKGTVATAIQSDDYYWDAGTA
jgi:hypothetical protein